MRIQRLSIDGASIVVPDAHRDDRGQFATHFSLDEPGGARFPVAQVSESCSHRGVVRGIHFTSTPPGCAKLVWCSSGSAVDFVVDLRLGSPTFGRVDQVELSPASGVAVSLPVGVGHAYQATADETVVTYLLSTCYVPEHEQAVAVSDPELRLELPLPREVTLSPRDRDALTLEAWLGRGGLPDDATSRAVDQELLAAARWSVENGSTTSASTEQ